MISIDNLFYSAQLTSLEKEILEYIINNIEICTTIGIRTIAKNTYSSPSTIIRLAKKIGYSGFLEMVYDLKVKYYSSNTYSMLKDIDNKHIFLTNSDDSVNRFINCIDKGNMYIFAIGFSEIIAEYLYKKLLVLGKKCVLSVCTDLKILYDHNPEVINSILVISKSGETPHCVKSAVCAKELGITVVSFTGNPLSSVAKNSDIVFTITDHEKLDYPNYYPNLFFAYCIETFEIMLFEYYTRDSNYKKIE